MTTSNPPSSQFFPGVNFNPAFFTDDDTTAGGISQDEADTRSSAEYRVSFAPWALMGH